MACRCAPALLQLRHQIDQAFPDRDRTSDGCCGDAAHAARKSDHNPDANGIAHALDIDEDIVTGLGDAPLLGWVSALLADPRCKYVIYEARIYYPGAAPKAYTGINAHRHHLHLSIRAGTENDTTPWAGPPPATAPADPEDDMPAPTDIVAVLEVSGKGAYLLQYDGGVRTIGAVPFHGSVPGLKPEQRLGFPGAADITHRPDGWPGYTIWDRAGHSFHFPVT